MAELGGLPGSPAEKPCPHYEILPGSLFDVNCPLVGGNVALRERRNPRTPDDEKCCSKQSICTHYAEWTGKGAPYLGGRTNADVARRSVGDSPRAPKQTPVQVVHKAPPPGEGVKKTTPASKEDDRTAGLSREARARLAGRDRVVAASVKKPTAEQIAEEVRKRHRDEAEAAELLEHFDNKIDEEDDVMPPDLDEDELGGDQTATTAEEPGQAPSPEPATTAATPVEPELATADDQ